MFASGEELGLHTNAVVVVVELTWWWLSSADYSIEIHYGAFLVDKARIGAHAH